MLESIRELAVNGQWQEVIEQGGALLASDHGLERDDVAWVHLTIAAGYLNTATDANGRNSTLRHAYEAYQGATPGGLRHASAMLRLSSALVDLGRSGQAKWFAHAYLKAAPKHRELAPFAGWALRNLGIAAMRAGNYSEAVKWYHRSFRAFAAAGNETQVARGRLHLVWAYCMSGQSRRARKVMPENAPHAMEHFFYSALAVLAAAEGRWHQVAPYAEEALRCERPGYDNVDAADLCTLASRAARRHGAGADAITYEYRTRVFAALQGMDVRAVLLLDAEPKGGEFLDATATLRGSSDLRDSGCFTTGVA